ncbi:MAG: phosphoribosylaminoimidazole-succinocarboxamide synthase [Clostridia bacterium]|jgi:phosphoribosylaminoimidazole-succinocarboxamide synthase|nr:phosphoribosylaminoimidazole-succinocarboxamide synthase [Clostridia bacterium]MDN5322816.1 phosphoribosylaminoimidazole-succinocarboxamide synthase [Clostridia bacterium]
MEKLEMLYEGKAKKIFKTNEANVYLVEYKDDATAFNGQKKGTIQSKGIMNNKIASIFFKLLEEKGIKTHFIKHVDDRSMLVKAVQIVPVEVIVRNIAAGTLAKRLGLEEGTVMQKTVLEFCLKSDELGDPMINNYHIAALDLASEGEMETITKEALKINDILREVLDKCGIELVDFKLEFGRTKDGEIILADEISPDTCRFWDKTTKEKMDKDRFRRDLGKVEDAYQEVLRRLEEAIPNA